MDLKGTWAKIVDTLLGWLKKFGGTAIVLAIIRYFKRRTWFAERKVEQKELELKHHENEDKVEKDNHGRSDIDIVNDAISEGRSNRDSDD